MEGSARHKVDPNYRQINYRTKNVSPEPRQAPTCTRITSPDSTAGKAGRVGPLWLPPLLFVWIRLFGVFVLKCGSDAGDKKREERRTELQRQRQTEETG